MGPHLLFMVALVAFVSMGRGQQPFLEYMERRIAILEDRISQWHDQSSRYSSDLREFKNKVLTLLENLEKEKDAWRSEMENTNIRVERLEREVDYLETQNPAPPCVEVDEKLTELQLNKAQKKKKEKYEKLTDCSDTISQVTAMKILKRFGSTSGLWTKDPLATSEKIYIFDGSSNDTVYVYPRMKEFTLSSPRKAARIKLPYSWIGTGHVVYGGHLYYIRRQNEFQVIKFDLGNKTVVDSAVFPVEQQVPVYGLSAFNYIDIAADEEGLWAVYATADNEKNICLAKIDPLTLGMEQMWDTPCPIENAESAFVICGALYVVYNAKLPSRSRVQCVFDASGTMSGDDLPLVYFPKRYGAHSSMKYNPKEKQIYAWDDGYQIIYKLGLKAKVEL
ncbi:olfactomedin-like protein 3 [Rhinatrema bivittatum]|uniref:olfactomedin-like protein 3 n=1 Tax=Rhinatrema bivittatum TaxID=194408 RepID=UPI001125EA85|nr:olfactomedin-like protein 3 [Rhinatrema bivittatum]